MVLVFFLVAESNLEGIPSRTDHLLGRLEVWDLLLVTIVLKSNLSELRLVQKKQRILTTFFCNKALKYLRVSLKFI